MPIERDNCFPGRISDKSLPRRNTRPSSGAKDPAIIRSRVVFPAPLGPAIATVSPGVMDTLNGSRIVEVP